MDPQEPRTKPPAFFTISDPEISKQIQKDIRESAKDRKETLSNLPLQCANAACKSNLRRTDLKQCAKCKLVRYCSRDCQRADWPQHKMACRDVSVPPIVAFTLRLVERAWAISRFTDMLLRCSIFTLGLHLDPTAAEKSFVVVPVTVLPADLSAFIQNPSDPWSLELGLSVSEFIVVEKDQALEKVRASEQRILGARERPEGSTRAVSPTVTFLFVPYEGAKEAEAGKIEQNTRFFMQVLVVPVRYLDAARKGITIEVSSALAGHVAYQLTKENAKDLIDGFNNDVRNDKTNKMKLRGFL